MGTKSCRWFFSNPCLGLQNSREFGFRQGGFAKTLERGRRINGFTDLNLTKLDVLSDLDVIKLGVGYKGPDRALLRSMPANITDLEAVQVRAKIQAVIYELKFIKN